MKLIYKASDINEAHIVSGMLRSNGIEAHVGGYYLQGGVGDLAAFGFANVHVPDEDVEQAVFLIAQYEDASKDNNGTVSKRDSVKFYISVILFIILIIAFLLFFFW